MLVKFLFEPSDFPLGSTNYNTYKHFESISLFLSADVYS